MGFFRRCGIETYLFLLLKGERRASDEDNVCLAMLRSSEVIFLNIDISSGSSAQCGPCVLDKKEDSRDFFIRQRSMLIQKDTQCLK
jgi:hypothetical protein